MSKAVSMRSLRGASQEALAKLRQASDDERQRAFFAVLNRSRLPKPVTELRFDEIRRWRFDYAWPAQMVALEVEGAVWTQGRHTRGSGFVKDMEKYNAAAVQGWRVLRCTPEQLTTATVERMLRSVLRSSPSSRAVDGER